jgi:hypothetical protein
MQMTARQKKQQTDQKVPRAPSFHLQAQRGQLQALITLNQAGANLNTVSHGGSVLSLCPQCPLNPPSNWSLFVCLFVVSLWDSSISQLSVFVWYA